MGGACDRVGKVWHYNIIVISKTLVILISEKPALRVVLASCGYKIVLTGNV